jgi:hypothetical protein
MQPPESIATKGRAERAAFEARLGIGMSLFMWLMTIGLLVAMLWWRNAPWYVSIVPAGFGAVIARGAWRMRHEERYQIQLMVYSMLLWTTMIDLTTNWETFPSSLSSLWRSIWP